MSKYLNIMEVFFILWTLKRGLRLPRDPRSHFENHRDGYPSVSLGYRAYKWVMSLEHSYCYLDLHLQWPL